MSDDMIISSCEVAKLVKKLITKYQTDIIQINHSCYRFNAGGFDFETTRKVPWLYKHYEYNWILKQFTAHARYIEYKDWTIAEDIFNFTDQIYRKSLSNNQFHENPKIEKDMRALYNHVKDIEL